MRGADDIKVNKLAEVADAFGMSLMELLKLGDDNESERSSVAVSQTRQGAHQAERLVGAVLYRNSSPDTRAAQ